MNKLIIIGASGHGKVIADIALLRGYKDIAFLDNDTSIKEVNGYKVIGTTKDIDKYSTCDFIVGIGNSKIREAIQSRLSNVVTLIHPSTVISNNVSIGKGSVVMAGVVINTNVSIGEGCIINTSSSIDHDCVIEDYVHIAVGTHLAGNVHIGNHTWLGIGSVVSNNTHITNNCMIGAGSVVVKDIDISGTYFGVPAKLKAGGALQTLIIPNYIRQGAYA